MVSKYEPEIIIEERPIQKGKTATYIDKMDAMDQITSPPQNVFNECNRKKQGKYGQKEISIPAFPGIVKENSHEH